MGKRAAWQSLMSTDVIDDRTLSADPRISKSVRGLHGCACVLHVFSNDSLLGSQGSRQLSWGKTPRSSRKVANPAGLGSSHLLPTPACRSEVIIDHREPRPPRPAHCGIATTPESGSASESELSSRF
jgi:hypothetical protein